MLKKLETESAPEAIGPYSQGVEVSLEGSLIFVSGQIPIDPKGGKLINGTIQEQTNQVIDNMEAVLKEGGSGLNQVLRVDIFLKDLQGNFAKVNEAYAIRFTGDPRPVRQTVEVSELPMGAIIEMSCIAYKGSK